ncbi:hypothetical protein [Bradyrhizobium septentrionale]|uniref:Uncharacterized protein n=1 Tax=Bradyrhizobium septentrionale TaxID=1404411 RepID=A0A973W3M8_9BRAD|nr:hypothetical protein [Bradyrhizobium septentrionale]UGY15585.1 hypothetical protein HAP48_0044925 [Bradyrhizobium septentrionale]UGY24161.1 hypothetical protein HU675_0040565 [Bradyrhizobium septentrionale]
MKWMKERDLLIAQTMAFVESVKGKQPDAGMPAPAPRTSAPPAAQQTATPPAVAPAPAAPALAAAAEALAEAIATFDIKPKPAAETRPAVVPPPLPVPTVIEGLLPAPPPLAVTVVEVPPPPAQPPQFAKLDISGDFGSEVRERVANFRAQQQRFLREREEYCTTTMAKVRAAIRDNSELPRSGK